MKEGWEKGRRVRAEGRWNGRQCEQKLEWWTSEPECIAALEAGPGKESWTWGVEV